MRIFYSHASRSTLMTEPRLVYFIQLVSGQPRASAKKRGQGRCVDSYGIDTVSNPFLWLTVADSFVPNALKEKETMRSRIPLEGLQILRSEQGLNNNTGQWVTQLNPFIYTGRKMLSSNLQ